VRASYLGDGVRVAALPLLAATLTTSPGEVALVSVAGGLPWLMFGLVAGVVVDRVERLRLMALTQVARAVIGIALVAGVAAGWLGIPLLAALVFLLYSCEVLYDIAFNSALPAVVERSRLQWANGRLITAEVVTVEFAGPAMGGLLFAVAPALPFAFDGVSFAVSALLLLALARHVGAREQRPAVPRRSLRDDLAEGLRWFWGQPVIRALTLVAAAVNLAAGGFLAVLVLLVQGELGAGPVGYGLVVAVGAVGSLIAGPVAGRLTSARQRRGCVQLVLPVAAASYAVIAIATSVWVVAVAMVVFGFVVTVANVIMVSLRQLLIPDALLGRAMAVHRVLCWGSLPIGAGLAGLVGELAGVRASIAACGLAALLLGLVAGLPLLRLPATEFAPDRSA
jgi:MFS family permease